MPLSRKFERIVLKQDQQTSRIKLTYNSQLYLQEKHDISSTTKSLFIDGTKSKHRYSQVQETVVCHKISVVFENDL